MKLQVIMSILLSFLMLTSTTLATDCPINNITLPISGSTAISAKLAGQQFIACETGTITTIQVSTSGGAIHLYLTEGNGDRMGPYGPPDQIFSGQAAGLVTLELATPFPVKEGDLYAFAIGNVTHINFDMFPVGPPANDIAPDGRFAFEIMPTTGAFTELMSSDLVFNINIHRQPIPTIPTIPTFNQWALFMFALIMVNMGLLLLRKKNKSTSS